MNVDLLRPSSTLGQVRSSYGMLGTYDTSVLVQTKAGRWGLLATGGALGTDGYIQQAPWQRGPVDINSNIHAQNGMLRSLNMTSGPLRLFARGSGFNEARANGTPYQNNGTRLWRYATGGDWQAPQRRNGDAAVLWLGGALPADLLQHFEPAPISATRTAPIAAARRPSRFALIPDNELGAAAHWNQPMGAGLLAACRRRRARCARVGSRTDFRRNGGADQSLVHQRDSGRYGELLWTHSAWTVAGSGRMDWFRISMRTRCSGTARTGRPQPRNRPQWDQNIFDPRLGISRKLGSHWAVSASGFRAFRAPTPSELYRSTQVGNKLTLPNGLLRASAPRDGSRAWPRNGIGERSAPAISSRRSTGPSSAVTIDPTSSPILLMRQNLGRSRAAGFSLDFESRAAAMAKRRWRLPVCARDCHARSQDLGNWIPEVARNMATLNLRAFKPRLAR